MPEYRCRKTNTPPAVDGLISPAVWDQAQPVSLPLADTGGEPAQPSEVRLLYDDNYLYVAFHCVDDEIWGTLTNRDDHVCSEEAVEIFISPTGDERFYHEIEVSPLNTIYDLYILNDPRCEPPIRFIEEWDCLDLKTAIHVEGELNSRTGNDKYWNCEMAIPFAEMHAAPNLPPKPGDRWRMNLYRIDRRRTGDEYCSWSRVGEINFHQPSKFGDLVFCVEGKE